jgi:hypothetical protein
MGIANRSLLRLSLFSALTALLVVLVVGCAEEIRGPAPAIGPPLLPNVACNADPAVGDATNGMIQTRIVLNAPMGAAGTFSPLPINRIAGTAGVALPKVVLVGPTGAATELELRQTEFVSTSQLALWVTRTSRGGMPLTPGVYDVKVINPNDQSTIAMGALRVTVAPVVQSVARIEPPVPAMPLDPNESRTICNGMDARVAITGQNFRPADPPPMVEIVDAMGALVRRISDADIMVPSATEVRIVIRGSMDAAMRLAPGTYGVRITNPDGTASAPMGGPGIGAVYPQGCRSTKLDVLTVVPPPELTSVAPVAVCSSRPNTFVLQGRFLRRGLSVTVDSVPPVMIAPADVMLSSAGGVDSVAFTIPMAALAVGGPYAVTVRNADGCTATLAPACPAGTMATMAANECQGMVGMSSGTGPRAITVYAEPTITAVTPMMVCSPGIGQMVAITGTGFHSTYGVPPTVTLAGVTLTNVMVTSPTMITATVPAPGIVAGGPYAVTVTLPEGCGVTQAMAVTAAPGPVVAAVIPSRGWNMIDMPVTILGDGFVGVTSIFLRGAGPMGADYPLRDIQVVDPTLINATIPAGAVAGGPYDLVVRTAGTCDAVLVRGYTVQSMPSLTVSRVIPPFGWTGGSTVVTITGAMFQSTPRAFLVIPARMPRLVPLSRVVFVNSGTLTAVIPPSLPVGGPYDLVVINPDGGGGLLPMAFRVTAMPPPRIDALNPSQGTTGSPTPITIAGSNFRAPATVTLTPVMGAGMFSASGVTVANMGTQITATVPTNTMPVGAYIVRVTNTDEMTYDEFGTFVVTNPSEKLGTFAQVTPLNVARRGPGGASGRVNAANRFVYAVGGDAGGAGAAALDSVEFAQVDIFGRLSPWVLQRNRLATARTRMGIVRQGQYLYAVGGSSAGASSVPLSSVERARILDFTDAPVIADPTVRRVPMGPGLAAGSWLYVVAAIKDPMMDPGNPNGESLASDEVVATLVSNSTVTIRWMPVAGATSYRVYRTPTVNGSSGGEVLLVDNLMATMFVDDGSRMPMMASADTTPLRVGNTGKWVTVSRLTGTRDGAAVTLAPDPSGALFLYALGGNGTCGAMGAAAPLSCYEFASVSADGASLGAWTAAMNLLTAPHYLAGGATATPSSVPGLAAGTALIFLTGGFNAPGSGSRVTELSRVQMGGTLAAFATANRTYGGDRSAAQASVVNGTFFVIGGTGGGAVTSAGQDSTVLAQMDATGAFSGPFSNASGRMVAPRSLHGLANESAYFFVIGGTSMGTEALNTVEQVIH